MLYSEGSGTRKVGFYGTYPGIKSKNGFAVYILNDDFCSRKEKRKISLFWHIWWLCKNMSKNLGKWRNLALVNLPIPISLPKLKTQVLNTNSYCKRWWSIISVKYVVRISLQIFCLSCIFPPYVDQISTKKIDEVTDERIVYTFGVQHHAFTKKKKICFNGFHFLAKTIIRSGYIFCFFWLIT